MPARRERRGAIHVDQLGALAEVGVIKHLRRRDHFTQAAEIMLKAPLDRASLVVHLNRYDDADPLHRENRAWLTERDGFILTTTIPDFIARL